MDENGEILLMHASKNNARPLVLPWFDDFDLNEVCMHRLEKFYELLAPKISNTTRLQSDKIVSIYFRLTRNAAWPRARDVPIQSFQVNLSKNFENFSDLSITNSTTSWAKISAGLMTRNSNCKAKDLFLWQK